MTPSMLAISRWRQSRVPILARIVSWGALVLALLAAMRMADAPLHYQVMAWLPALVPAFMLTFYRGWRGAAVGFTAVVAAAGVGQAASTWVFGHPLDVAALAAVGSTLLVVCTGLACFGELMHRARLVAETAALTDPLTGLANRRLAGVFLDSAFGGAERGNDLFVVLFDLDHFKRLNDEHGHAAGDRTLVAFAEMLRTHTRRSDLSARVGGEEFIAVLTGSGGVSGAAQFAERVRESFGALHFPWGKVTVSAGIAPYEPEASSPETVIATADRALYQAKAQGRDRVIVEGNGPRLTDRADAAERDPRRVIAMI